MPDNSFVLCSCCCSLGKKPGKDDVRWPHLCWFRRKFPVDPKMIRLPLKLLIFAPMRFAFPHSHAFPGGRVTVDDDGKSGPECLVEFGDGVTVIAEWRRSASNIVLSVPSYRTARGAQVAPKTWRLAQRKDGIWRSQRET